MDKFFKTFNRLYNNRRNAEEIESCKWIYHLTTGQDGMGITSSAGPVANQLCNIAEGLLDWFRKELNRPELTFHDVNPAVEEDDDGSRHYIGDLIFAVYTPGKQDIIVELPEVVADMVASDVAVAQTVIISRHSGAVEWLKSKGYYGTVVDHFDGNVECGATYIGVLPIPLVSKIVEEGGNFLLLSLPKIAFSERGQELSPEEMTVAGATVHKIITIKLKEV